MEQRTELSILCENIAYLRKKHELTEAQMAKILGVGIAMLRRVEDGEMPKSFSTESLLNLSVYFKIPAAKLFLPLK